MREPSELQKQQYERFTEILNAGKRRYIEAKGTHKGYRAGLKGQDYLTDEERQEALLLVRQLFQVREKSDDLTTSPPLPKEQVEADS